MSFARNGFVLLFVNLLLVVAKSPQSQSVDANREQATSQVLEIGIVANVPKAEAVELVTPIYPGHIHVAGEVIIEVILNSAGKVISAHALSGPALLVAPAVEAARHSEFRVDSGSNGRNLTGKITYAFRFGELGYDDLRFFIGQQVTLRGDLSLRGKIGPFVLVSGKPVYLVRQTNADLGSRYQGMEGKSVIVTGTLRFHRAPVEAHPSELATAQVPDHFYFEAETAVVRLEKR
jgi:hypothetical protein